MVIQVNSIAELQRVMMEQVSQAMQQTEDFVIEETKDAVNQTVYQQYTPDRYKRTYALRDSIQITERYRGAGGCGMVVGHNGSASWFSIGEGTTSDVPSIVTNGNYGTFVGMADDQFGNYSWHDTTPKGSYCKPRNYMEEAVQSLMAGNKYLQHLVAKIGNGATIR